MEYLEGRIVQQLLEEHQGAPPFSATIHLLRPMAEGIDAAHVRNIVHGDLKPANHFSPGRVAQARSSRSSI
jgi:tRNA A-37 threonylcarbamoyl transferase component Bud32